MFKNSLTIIVAITSVTSLLVACGSYNTLSLQKEDVAYLQFTKSSDAEYLIVVNDSREFILSKCVDEDNAYCTKEGLNKSYEVKSGNNKISVFNESGSLIYTKEIYVGSENVKRVDLP
jgi:hypothetical protein